MLRRSHGKTQGGRIASYLTDEQRSHVGWIGASKCEVIFERALRLNQRIENQWKEQPYILVHLTLLQTGM